MKLWLVLRAITLGESSSNFITMKIALLITCIFFSFYFSYSQNKNCPTTVNMAEMQIHYLLQFERSLKKF